MSTVFAAAKGRALEWAKLEAPNSAFGALLLTSGSTAHEYIYDYGSEPTVADLLASNTEQTAMGRQVVPNVTQETYYGSYQAVIKCDPITWAAPAGDPVRFMVMFYDPDTTTSTDAERIPILIDDFQVLGVDYVPDGIDVTWTPSTDGIYSAY